MLNRYWPLFAGGILVVAIIWSLATRGQNSEVTPTPSATRQTQPRQTPARETLTESPFLSAHKSTWDLSPNQQNVDSRFHSEFEQLRMSVDTDSNDVDALLKLARFTQDGHQLEEAVALYRRVVKLEPGNRDAWLDLTRCYGELGQWSSALAAVDEMLDHNPDDPGGLYNKGAILANLGELDQAREVWKIAATQDADLAAQAMAASALARLNRR